MSAAFFIKRLQTFVIFSTFFLTFSTFFFNFHLNVYYIYSCDGITRCVGEIKWPLLVQPISLQSAAESIVLPPQAQLMLIGVKLSSVLVTVAINNGKSALAIFSLYSVVSGYF